MEDRGHLLTECHNESSARIDSMAIGEAFDVINNEDATIAVAVAAAKDGICQAIDLVVAAFRSSGRLIYIGAGTSGRLGVLDASECPPTFLSDPTMVQGFIAGGWDALRRSVEGAEDHPADAEALMDELAIGQDDVVFGIATGGTTPYVHGAIGRAKKRGAKTVFMACVTASDVPDEADVSIRVLVGPEVVTGSTRLKAGTATKMVLNLVTTISMIQIGKVYGNLMVDVNTRANAKLVDRGMRMVQRVTGLNRAAAHELLDAANGHVKSALVMHATGVDHARAERLLAKHGGQVSKILQTDEA